MTLGVPISLRLWLDRHRGPLSLSRAARDLLAGRFRPSEPYSPSEGYDGTVVLYVALTPPVKAWVDGVAASLREADPFDSYPKAGPSRVLRLVAMGQLPPYEGPDPERRGRPKRVRVPLAVLLGDLEGGWKDWTEIEFERLARARAAGYKPGEIGRYLGLTPKRVAVLLKKNLTD